MRVFILLLYKSVILNGRLINQCMLWVWLGKVFLEKFYYVHVYIQHCIYILIVCPIYNFWENFKIINNDFIVIKIIESVLEI